MARSKARAFYHWQVVLQYATSCAGADCAKRREQKRNGDARLARKCKPKEKQWQRAIATLTHFCGYRLFARSFIFSPKKGEIGKRLQDDNRDHLFWCERLSTHTKLVLQSSIFVWRVVLTQKCGVNQLSNRKNITGYYLFCQELLRNSLALDKKVNIRTMWKRGGSPPLVNLSTVLVASCS